MRLKRRTTSSDANAHINRNQDFHIDGNNHACVDNNDHADPDDYAHIHQGAVAGLPPAPGRL